MELDPKLLLQKLIEKNILTQESATKLEQEALVKKIPIDQYLQSVDGISSDDILRSKAELLNVPYVNIALTPVDPSALNFIPRQIAEQNHIIPYLFDTATKQLYVATSNPLKIASLEYLTTKRDIKIVPVLAAETDIMKAMNIAYSLNLSPMVKEAVADISSTSDSPIESISTSNEFNSAPIAKIVNTIVEFGIKSRASDIHIEPQDIKTRVRYRIDGILMEKLSLPRSIHDSLISRIKILGGMKIDEKRLIYYIN